MSGSNPAYEALFFLPIFSIIFFRLSSCNGNTTTFCPEIEKQSLLSFKQSLKDPDNLLSSWDSEVNCCQWKGIVCNNLSGHVGELHLRTNLDEFQGLSGKLNPSLLNLTHLRYLDLSQNRFTQETIPSFIGFFTNLEYLNLSFAGFHGKIPYNIGNLSNLHTLSLESYQSYYDKFGQDVDSSGMSQSLLTVDNLEWLSGLSQMEHLNMNGVNMSKATNWAQVINTLPSLLELHLRGCVLDFSASLGHVNITSLTFLDLSYNYAQSFAIPRWIFQLSNLVSLDLHFNSFKGPTPTVSNATKLWYIDFSGNSFNSSIPNWLYFIKDLEFVYMRNCSLHGTISNAIANLTFLNTLDLSKNQLSGKIPREIANLCKIHLLDLSANELQGETSDSFGNMSECFLGALEFLQLSHNQLSGHLTNEFGEFKILQYLFLEGNSLSGEIPITLGKLSSLKLLSLGGNKFTGNLPESLGQLYNLEYLYIEDNMLEGVVTESHFATLTKLATFSASKNHLTLKISPDWIPSFQLKSLRLCSWNFGAGSQIPSWLETQKNIDELDLSNTGISGNIPSSLWEINFLDLSHNDLHGKIPHIRGPEYGKASHKRGAQYVYLSSNQFNGALPQITGSVRELDLSNNSFSGGISHFLCDVTNKTHELRILHLGGNQLTGDLPDCWMKWSSLGFMNLGDNSLSGSIPNSIGFLSNLRSLNLYKNKLSGQMPLSMQNCTKLLKIDLADNDLDGMIPTWMGSSLVKLKILILRSNKLSDRISSEICFLNSLQILDLSDNKFSGTIPRCIYNFTAMATKRSLVEYGKGRSGYSYSIQPGVFIESASVATKGSEFQYDTILSLVTNIDLSKNNLSGDIPKELASLVELRSLNLSENYLTGVIPDNIGELKQLESLDVSRNSLSGQIPDSFALLSSLNYLNLSHNNLTGRVPKSTQILGFDASSFIGNNLCGPPLTSNCSHDVDEVHGHKEEFKIKWFYVFLSLGYAVGFSIVCIALALNKSWKEV